jgi:hypothetical protein
MEPEPPIAEPPKRKRRWYQFSLRTLLIVMAVAAILVWGARQLLDSGMESHRIWLHTHGLPDDPEFPAADHLLIDERVVVLVMFLALLVGILLILRGRKNRRQP